MSNRTPTYTPNRISNNGMVSAGWCGILASRTISLSAGKCSTTYRLVKISANHERPWKAPCADCLGGSLSFKSFISSSHLGVRQIAVMEKQKSQIFIDGEQVARAIEHIQV